MAKEKKSSEYTKRQDGGATVFTVTPAPAPKFTAILVIGGVMGLLGLSMLAGGPGIIFLAMAAFCFWYGWTRDLRPKETRQPATFRVTADRIESGGQTFSKDDIHRLILRNSITDQEVTTIYTTNANVAAGLAYRGQVARVANTLTVESGGKSSLIAGGMDETTAFGLLSDVCKIMGYEVN